MRQDRLATAISMVGAGMSTTVALHIFGFISQVMEVIVGAFLGGIGIVLVVIFLSTVLRKRG